MSRNIIAAGDGAVAAPPAALSKRARKRLAKAEAFREKKRLKKERKKEARSLLAQHRQAGAPNAATSGLSPPLTASANPAFGNQQQQPGVPGTPGVTPSYEPNQLNAPHHLVPPYQQQLPGPQLDSQGNILSYQGQPQPPQGPGGSVGPGAPAVIQQQVAPNPVGYIRGKNRWPPQFSGRKQNFRNSEILNSRKGGG